MMCPMSSNNSPEVWCFGIKIFLFVWIILVPVVVTARLEKIIKLLEEKK